MVVRIRDYAPSIDPAAPSFALDGVKAAPFVLVVEDDRHIRETLVEMLDESGYRVDSVSNARDALTRAERGPIPDVILLDLMMPTMDGWQFRVEQRTRPRIADIPVVVISADVSAKAIAIDADAFVKKPFDFDTLHGVIERLLLSSERRRLELQTRELERLRALGTLVAGVAHEINNPLTFISTNLEIMARDLKVLRAGLDPTSREGQRLDRAMAGARLGADRIETVVRALSRFSRPDDERLVPLDVTGPIESAITLGTGQSESRVRIERRFEPTAAVMGSESRLGQVFLNLIVNASQAVLDAGIEGGTVEVATFDEDGCVVIEVRDDGPGIPADVLPNIFEPFFTTKAAGHGTGLGLSLSKDIVVAHGGSLTAISREGAGAIFRVELPAVRATRPPPRRSSRPSAAPPIFLTRARILVIDDESLVGTVFEDAFPDLDVRFFSSARSALDHLEAERDVHYDVVVSDSRMPGMTGSSFFDESVGLHPELRSRFIFATGTIDANEIVSLEARAMRPVIHKPFSIDELRNRLREVLDSIH